VHVRFFGTYDARRHPRVRVLREGLEGRYQVREDNVPVAIDTAMRVEALGRPWRLLAFVPIVLCGWGRLVIRSRSGPRPDVVVVGHLGHLDIVLARLLFPRATLVLDYMISAADTARDRAVGDRGVVYGLLHLLDRLATRVADVVVVDTPESLETAPQRTRHKTVVVPVGADHSWFAAGDAEADIGDGPARPDGLSVVFFGLYTPLQGAPVIGAALRDLHERGTIVTATMIGAGQERASTEAACGGAPVTWIDWVDADELPTLVASHDVCLGIFGVGPKARRVVPNKFYQGAAAGCVIVTADSEPQRRALPLANFVQPGDGPGLADVLQDLSKRADLHDLARRTRDHAQEHFRPDVVVIPLVDALARDHAAR